MDQLFIKARGGDEKAEKELFQYLFVRFKNLAERRIGKGEAEDIAQEACMTVLQKYKTESFTKGFAPWAYGVLKMKIGNYMQGLMAKQKDFTSTDNVEHILMTPSPEPEYELKRKMIGCLKQMIVYNRRYAQVINYFHQGFTTDEICLKFNIKPNNFYVILNRIRRMLKGCLQTGRI
jgi:RNA polymerase sigma factor (sigma-70 family)